MGTHSINLKRRACYTELQPPVTAVLSGQEQQMLNDLRLFYRTLCSIIYNFAQSGHPGGSISAGPIIIALLTKTMDYDFNNPDRPDADQLVLGAGHKALGLYAINALCDEFIRISKRNLLPIISERLRLLDLLGYRRNPVHQLPLFRRYRARPLDGHPTPATPFVKLATGASGVGLAAGCGLASSDLDYYGENSSIINIVDGEGGMTPGRVSEALAMASASQLRNLVLHVDLNNASIDTDQVCPANGQPGQYVQWTPQELLFLQGWNVVVVPDGHDFNQIILAQQLASRQDNNQPTAIVYHTIKGRGYGIEGRASHGTGHKFCSAGYYNSLGEFEQRFGVTFPRLDNQTTPEEIERLYYDTLMTLSQIAEQEEKISSYVANSIAASRKRLSAKKRRPRPNAPQLSNLYSVPYPEQKTTASDLVPLPGTKITLREVLGKILDHLNQKTNGAFLVTAADLLGSTSVDKANNHFPPGFYSSTDNPYSRLIPGGIWEDGQGAFMTGVSANGHHIGVTASYAAFIAPLQLVAARLHCIGQQARRNYSGNPFNTFIMVCGHAGYKTGEDGPTHADPQALQLLSENFPPGMVITLTPWDARELWPLMRAALRIRPAVLAPFVTRPPEEVLNRTWYGLPPETAAINGIYKLRSANPQHWPYHGTIILQGSAVTNDFIPKVLPLIDQAGYQLNIYYIASTELFLQLPAAKQRQILPAARRREAMAITDFTMPTMYHWVTSDSGRRHSLSAFTKGKYPGSGTTAMVMKEMGLDWEAQWNAVQRYCHDRLKK